MAFGQRLLPLLLLALVPSVEARDCSFVKPTLFCGEKCSADKYRKRCYGESYTEKNQRTKREHQAAIDNYEWQEELSLRYKEARYNYQHTGKPQQVCTSSKWRVDQPMSKCPKSSIDTYPSSK